MRLVVGEVTTTPAAGKCIDRYTALRVEQFANNEAFVVDPRLEGIVDRMFQRCFDTNELKQASSGPIDESVA